MNLVPTGPCTVCGAHGPGMTRIRHVASGSGPDQSVVVCPDHVHQFVSQTRDLDFLARRRAEATGETLEEAKAALSGIPDGGGSDGTGEDRRSGGARLWAVPDDAAGPEAR